MKNIPLTLTWFILSASLILHTTSASAQAIDPERSARAAATSDAQFIAGSIEDNRDAIFLSQKAMDHATDPRVKDLAQQMLEDHTTMLYSMQQLEEAGTGSSKQSITEGQDAHKQAATLSSSLSGASGMDFDTLWVSSLLVMQQARYDKLTRMKETAANPRLKMAITEASPLMRKHLTQLRSLQKYFAKIVQQNKKEAAARQRSR